MLLSCGVWTAYGPLIACASWTERLYVWEARVSSLSVFSVAISLWNPRAGSGSGRPCMHASIPVPRGGARSASHPWSPDRPCPGLSSVGGWVPWSPSARAAVFPCTIAAPRHRTLCYPTLTIPYPDRTYRTLPACTMLILFCVSLT